MKAGIFIYPVNEPIVERVMKDYQFSKVSPAINFILQKYDEYSKGQAPTVREIIKEVKVKEEKPKPTPITDFSDWFDIDEDK